MTVLALREIKERLDRQDREGTVFRVLKARLDRLARIRQLPDRRVLKVMMELALRVLRAM
jgi:hypothetical protein